MVDTIQLKFLENKSIVAEVNGKNYAYEGGYNIVAGDVNATEFEIVSVPAKYKDFTITVAMTNSRGQNVAAPEIKNNKFTLPIGMAVAGYGRMVFAAHGIDENGNSVAAYFLPLKIKISKTDDSYTSGIINGTISISRVVTLPPDSDAYAINTGTSTDAIIELGIPEGKGFVIDKTYPSVAAMNAGYATDGVRLYGFAIIDTGNVEDEDNAKLFIKGDTSYSYLTDMSGAQGIKGEPGAQGVGIASITPNGTDANGGNKYTITLTNGETAELVAPKGAKGDTGATGNGISSTTITYATSTSGTSAPSTGWQPTIPVVEKGGYLWTRTLITYTDGTSSTSYTSAYQGKDGTGAVTGVKGAAETEYRTGNVNLTAENIGAVPRAYLGNQYNLSFATGLSNRIIKLGTFPVNNENNKASLVVSGSIGGWTSGDKYIIDIVISNRDGWTVGGFSNADPSWFGFCHDSNRNVYLYLKREYTEINLKLTAFEADLARTNTDAAYNSQTEIPMVLTTTASTVHIAKVDIGGSGEEGASGGIALINLNNNGFVKPGHLVIDNYYSSAEPHYEIGFWEVTSIVDNWVNLIGKGYLSYNAPTASTAAKGAVKFHNMATSSVALSNTSNSAYTSYTINSSSRPRFLTVYGLESQALGGIIISKSTSISTSWDHTLGSDELARADGERAYWGSQILCCSALIPAGQTVYIYTRYLSSARYTLQEIFAD